jgi:HTH-type transcriptional regulator / antitoxin HigA
MATPVLDFTKPHVLRTVREYNAAVAEVDRLLEANPKRGSPEDNRLEFLTVLIQAYEDERVAEPRDVTPQEAVEFFLEQHGATRTELAQLMGGRSRVSDFFNGKRDLSTTQIKALRDRFGIPADLLIR